MCEFHFEKPKGEQDVHWVVKQLTKLKELLADKPLRTANPDGSYTYEGGSAIYDMLMYKYLSRVDFEGPELWVVNGPVEGPPGDKYVPYAEVS